MENLHQIFIQEASELLKELEESLLSFEKDLSDLDAVQGIFRVMHTLKGSSAMFGYSTVNDFTHELEYIYDGIRENKIKATEEILELTLNSVDHLKLLISNPLDTSPEIIQNQTTLLSEIKKLTLKGDSESPSSTDKTKNTETQKCYYIHFKPHESIFLNCTNPAFIIEDLLELGSGIVLPSVKGLPGLADLNYQNSFLEFEIVLVSTADKSEVEEIFMFVEGESQILVKELDYDLDLTEELIKNLLDTKMELRPLGINEVIKILAVKNLETRLTSDTIHKEKQAKTPPRLKRPDEKQVDSVRVASSKLDAMMNQISELVTTQARLNMMVNDLADNELSAIAEAMNKITRSLRETAFSICLLPIDNLMLRFKRLIRDLSKDLDKDIEFITHGTDTELDKSVMDKLSDPLLHLVRNCIDHGIEGKEEREKAGKAPKGQITLSAYNSGTNVIIELKDDGRGINREKILSKAIKNNLIKEGDQLSDAEVYQLLFAPGFSTAQTVTDISGRGVGMDVAKKGIEDIQGSIEILSKRGEGTTFKISLPLTLSIIDGLLVEVGDETFVLPLQTVEKCYEVPRELLPSVNQQVVLEGQRTPVFNLRDAFAYPQTQKPLFQVIKTRYQNVEIGLAVDSIIGEHQVVLKPLGDLYKEQQEYSGATILGDGTVALVFDVNKLIGKLTSGDYQKLNEKNYAK